MPSMRERQMNKVVQVDRDRFIADGYVVVRGVWI